MFMDKANWGFKQCVIISVLVVLMGLMVTAGCGNETNTTSQTSQAPDTTGQRPKDLDTLFTTNNCVSCDLSNWYIVDLDLSNSDLTNANLTNTSLANSNLTNANLTNTILNSANLTGAKLDGAILDKAMLAGATWVDGSECSIYSNNGHCEPK
jgi:uncharacterized protein YjbI with pentapeptide repeats